MVAWVGGQVPTLGSPSCFWAVTAIPSPATWYVFITMRFLHCPRMAGTSVTTVCMQKLSPSLSCHPKAFWVCSLPTCQHGCPADWWLLASIVISDPGAALIFQSYHSITLQLGNFSDRMCLHGWGLEVWDSSGSSVGFLWGLCPWLEKPVSSLNLLIVFPLCAFIPFPLLIKTITPVTSL